MRRTGFRTGLAWAVGLMWLAAVPAGLVLGADVPGSSLAALRFDGRGVLHWKLPRKLEEISGLARTADGRILAHEDQNGIVYEIDPQEGRLVKAFALGTPTVRADFEGIAVAEGRVYLVSSEGRLYETVEADDGERTRFNTYDAAVDDVCREVEGLAYEPRDRTLLLACKRVRDRFEGAVVIFRWSLETRSLADPPTLEIPEAALRPPRGDDPFRPSGIDRIPASGHYLLLSAKSRSLAEITPGGQVRARRWLPEDDHRQPEGLAVGADGSVLVADEGAGARARLSVYPGLAVPRP